jgi:DnaJ homolog subfamily C member 19
MTKLLILVLIVIFGCKLIVRRWPWELAGYSGHSREKSRARNKARVLLGLSRSAGRNEIIDAHRQLVARVHPDKGGTSDLVVEANDARDMLLAELARTSRAKGIQD